MKKLLFISLATSLIQPSFGIATKHIENIIFKGTSDLIDLGISKASIKIAYEKAGCNYELVDEVSSARKSQIFQGCTPQFQISDKFKNKTMFAGNLDKNLACLKKEEFYKKLGEGNYGFKEFVESKFNLGSIDYTRTSLGTLIRLGNISKNAATVFQAAEATTTLLREMQKVTDSRYELMKEMNTKSEELIQFEKEIQTIQNSENNDPIVVEELKADAKALSEEIEELKQENENLKEKNEEYQAELEKINEEIEIEKRKREEAENESKSNTDNHSTTDSKKENTEERNIVVHYPEGHGPDDRVDVEALKVQLITEFSQQLIKKHKYYQENCDNFYSHKTVLPDSEKEQFKKNSCNRKMLNMELEKLSPIGEVCTNYKNKSDQFSCEIKKISYKEERKHEAKKKINSVENSHKLNTCYKTNTNPNECMKLKKSLLEENGITEEDLIEHAPEIYAMTYLLKTISKKEKVELFVNKHEDILKGMENRNLTLESMRKAITNGATDLIPEYIKLKNKPLDDFMTISKNDDYENNQYNMKPSWLERQLEKEAEKCQSQVKEEKSSYDFSHLMSGK